MKLLCKLSGLYYETPAFGSWGTRSYLESEHPIFSLPQEILLQQSGAWAGGRLNEQERRLLFLALLRSTKLVDFNYPACPTDGIVQNSMEKLLRLIAWYSDISSPQLLLPRYSITRDTASLVNIKHWFESWDKVKYDWENKAIERSRSLQALKQSTLDRVLKSNASIAKTNKAMASWAMEAANVPRSIRAHWTKIFLLEGIAVFSREHSADIDEMLEHFQCNIDHYNGHLYARKVLQHIRDLWQKNRAGFSFGIGMSDEELLSTDFSAAEEDPYKLVSLEEYNQMVAGSNAPPEEPKRAAYEDNISYLRAKVAWKNAMFAHQKKLAAVQRRIDRIKAAELAAVSEVEAETEAAEDAAQTAFDFSRINGISAESAEKDL